MLNSMSGRKMSIDEEGKLVRNGEHAFKVPARSAFFLVPTTCDSKEFAADVSLETRKIEDKSYLPDYNVYLMGFVNNWQAEDAYSFSLNGNDCLELETSFEAGVHEFKFANDNWEKNGYRSSCRRGHWCWNN